MATITANPPTDPITTYAPVPSAGTPTKVLNLDYGGRRFTVERLLNNLIFVKTKSPTGEEVKVPLKVKESGSLTDQQILDLITNEFETNAGQNPLKDFLAASGVRPTTIIATKLAPVKTVVKIETSVTLQGKTPTKVTPPRPLGDRFVVAAGINTNFAATVIAIAIKQ